MNIDANWWRTKHAQDCGSLAKILHARTEQLFELRDILGRMHPLLEKMEHVVDETNCAYTLLVVKELCERALNLCNAHGVQPQFQPNVPLKIEEQEVRPYPPLFTKIIENNSITNVKDGEIK